MASIDRVRPSRDGDQFHYYWAARQCLRLLPPNTDLVAISIEGPAVADGAQVGEGIDSIDVAEYRGSTDPRTATHIRYIQLKHSSRRTEQEWIASDLAATLQNFGARYLKFVATFGEEDVANRFSFEFVTNRPFAASLEDGLEQLRSGKVGAKGRAAAKAMGLAEDAAAGFARVFTVTGRTHDFLEQRSLLHDDVSGYLPEADRDAPLQMKHLVEKRATTEFEHRPEINRFDVLKALGARLEDLYPAKSLIELPGAIVPRNQLRSLADQIVAGGSLSIIRADAGVGKSVLSTQLGALLPADSQTFVYDCFGNGAYRSASGYRHRCRDGLVQLANEMAGRSLGDPLIPTSKADPAAYVRAFMARAERAAALVKVQAPDAVLCIVIDAADNAQIAADELHDGPSFPRLMLRETWPANMRVVLTARPHRVDMLDPPRSVPRLDLESFGEAETAQHLRVFFSKASDQDVREFHRQTSTNPRVQATALAQPGTLAEVFLGLAGEPRTVDDLIGELLQAAIDRVMSDAPQTERTQIDRVSAALATLRPFVPLDVVARVADVPIAMVRSMAHDLQRPLIVREGAIQFRDEPTETWFRDRFRPTGEQLDAFISRLLPAAAGSAYVAAGLPQLLLEAGRFDDLVRLALTDEALPDEPAMARRDVALQRLQFALKAAIRDKRYLDAAKLALKAGGETAADARQQKLISANTDLGRHFLEPEQMLEQVSRRLIAGGEWTGSEHGYEAAFLSGLPELAGDAGSKLRLAYDWLRHWAKQPLDDRGSRQSVKSADVAEMALAEFNLHGAEACAKSMRRWRARERSFKAGVILVSRLIDAGRFDEIAELAIAAGNDLGLLLAITSEIARVGRFPPKPAVERMTRLVTSRHVRIEEPSGQYGGDILLLGAVTDMVVAALWHRTASKRLLARTLTRYMPVRPPSLEGPTANYRNGRTIYLSAYSLRAALRNESVTAEKLKPLALRPSKAKRDRLGKSRKSRRRYTADSGEVIRFEEDMGALLPWHLLAADVRIGRVEPGDLEGRIASAAESSSTASKRIYDERRSPSDEVAMLWGGIALGATQPASLIEAFETWRQELSRSLYTPTLLELSRRAGRTDGCARLCLDLGHAAFKLMAGEREDAQGIAEVFVEVCRAVLLTSPGEAREYFEQAIEVSGKIGEENLHRWRALSDLALATGADRADRPELAYRFSRVAELVYAYTENFDWGYTVKSLVALSPPSGPTILSRWIDRRFANQHGTLPQMVAALRDREALDPRDAICLLPFHSLSSRNDILRDALRAAGKGEERVRIAAHFLRYVRHLYSDAGDWRRVAKLLEDAGVDPVEAKDLALRAEQAAAKPRAQPARQRETYRVEHAERDWDAVFKDLELTDAGGIAEAHVRFRGGEPPWSPDLFYPEAMSRVVPGQEAAFIAALDAAAFSRLYDTRELLRELPETWRRSLAVRRAIARFLKGLARRECMSITTNNHYPALPWDELPQFGLSRHDIFREAVTAMGDTSLPVSYGDLFDLLGLLSTMVSAEEAAEALGYGLSLMEPLLLEGDDGPWRPELAPPKSVPDALAGYVWAALGSPWAERRWEAAHVVRALCGLDRAAALDALSGLAAAANGDAFAAPDLVFYALHAQLWLTIALGRAAEESPAAAAKFLPLIESTATRDNPHVLLRDFAAQVLLAFHAQGQITLDAERVSALQAINISQLPRATKRSGAAAFSKMWSVGSGFLFRHDFGQYWAAPLGRRFQISQDDVQAAGADVIHQLWGPEETGAYERDQRTMRRQFNEEREYRLQTNWPRVDELSFYHSVHAIMIVAGQFLDNLPIAGSEDEPHPFNEWLDRYRLSLESGLWLSDRRDDKPMGLWLDLPIGGAERHLDSCLTDLLTPPGGLVMASADWETHSGTIRQSFDVGAVLVSADRSDDLARALQSARDHNDYRLPTAEGDADEIDEDGWFVRSLLRSDERDRRLDRYDPWADGLRARLPAPGALATTALSITADRAQRIWLGLEGAPELRAEIWSDGEENDDQALHDRGLRLLATRGALDRLMERTGKHLLFELRLRVDRLETRYTRYMEKEKFDAVNLTRYLLLRPGHAFEAAPRIARTRGRARRPAQS